eukprot:gene10748-11899_t
MDISKEEENFFRVCKLLVNAVPVHLRTLFKDKWDGKHPINKWDDNPASGSGPLLIKEINKFNPGFLKRNAYLEKKFKQEGDSTKWDVTALCGAILNADLQLSDREKNTVIQIRDIRNKRLFHFHNNEISNNDTKKIFTDVKKAYQILHWPENELNKIKDDLLTTKAINTLQNQINFERKLAIQNNSTNFHNLPEDIQNYVGRKEEMDEVLDAVDKRNHKRVILIHGGPCYGKSAFATKFGYEMVAKGYSYVIWIDMRNIADNAPTADSLAVRILHEFDIDVDDCKHKAQKFLERKCKNISKNKKQLLIILDNADSLMPIAENSSNITDAYKMMKGLSSDCVKVALTSRSNRLVDVHNVQIKLLTDIESYMYIESKLKEDTLVDRDDLVERLNACSHGMPLALKILVNAVNNAENFQYLQDYLIDVKKKTINTINDRCSIMHLFEISFEYLQNEELKLIKMLAVYPSAFSYKYLKMLAHQFNIKDVRTILDAIKKKGLLEVNAIGYSFHPFLLEYIRDTKWGQSDEKKYVNCFLKVYAGALFDLGRVSLEKDQFLKCLSEFKAEKINFLYMMDLLKKEDILSTIDHNVFKRPANEYISMMLFAMDLVYSPFIIHFLKVCKTLASDEFKYYARCCYYEVFSKIYPNEANEEPTTNGQESEADKRFCRLLLERRKLTVEVHSRESSRRENEDLLKDLERLRDEAEQLSKAEEVSKCTLSKYLKIKIIKLLGVFYQKSKEENSQEKALSNFEEALEVSEGVFGKHLVTFDCYMQIAKCHWYYKNYEEADQRFEAVKDFAESMNILHTNRFSSYLLSHGRCLIYFGLEEHCEEYVQKGVALLEQSLETCDDTHSLFFASAMNHLMRADKDYHNEKLLPYFYDLEDPSGKICHTLTSCVRFSKDIDELLKASSFLKEILDKKEKWSKDNFDQVEVMLVWNKMVMDHPDVSRNSVKAEANKDTVFNVAVNALNSRTAKTSDEWVSIVRGLCYNDVKYYEWVLPHLKKQEHPSEHLLQLVKDKFFFDINAAYGEVDEYAFETRVGKVINEMQGAIIYLQDSIESIEDRIKLFHFQYLYDLNKILAITTISEKRSQFARDALHWINKGAGENYENNLTTLENIQSYEVPTSPDEKKKDLLKARKSLLQMMTKRMIYIHRNNELENFFLQLLTESMAFPDLNIGIQIIQHIFRNLDIAIQKYPKYLKALFQLLSSATSEMSQWHYNIFIRNLPKLLSSPDEFDQTHSHPGVEISHNVLKLLNKENRLPFRNDGIVKFEMLHILAMYTEGKIHVSDRLDDARSAISLFESLEDDSGLRGKVDELRDFVASNRESKYLKCVLI